MNGIERIFPRARSELLRLLFTEPERSLHLRDLARLSGLAVGTIQREVANLGEAGLLLERRDGNRLYFRANPDHPIFPDLRSIALKSTGLASLLTEALGDLDGIRMAFVHGSFASGTTGPDSDIDLLVVGTPGLRQLAPRLRPVSEAMGREINPHALSERAFREKLRQGDAFISHVTKHSKIWIVGGEDALAAMAGERVASAP